GSPPEVEWTYDDAGFRIAETTPTEARRFRWDRETMAFETNVLGNLLVRYDHGPDRLLAETEAGNTRTWLTDALKTPVKRLTETGTTYSVTRYDEYGEVEEETSPDIPRFGFTGHQRGPAEVPDLYYAQQRWYNAATGRFISEDPVWGEPKRPPSLHRYLYAYANPTVFVDPDGREACIGQPLTNCPLEQYVPNNRSIPVQVSEAAFEGVPETMAVASDRSDRSVSLPPSQHVFTKNYRLVPTVDPEQPDGVRAFNAISLEDGTGQFRVSPRDLDAFVANEDSFRNLAAFNQAFGGNRPHNVRLQRALSESLNRGLLGNESERSIVGEMASSWGEAVRDPVFLAESATAFVGGVALKAAPRPKMPAQRRATRSRREDLGHLWAAAKQNPQGWTGTNGFQASLKGRRLNSTDMSELYYRYHANDIPRRIVRPMQEAYAAGADLQIRSGKLGSTWVGGSFFYGIGSGYNGPVQPEDLAPSGHPLLLRYDLGVISGAVGRVVADSLAANSCRSDS
ncbi:MAG: hypothetical protein GVY11_02395, partial [Gammaproteobacteria bacterium]|nr:hypothetical protein [Gammaproteobacteria bacterium]